MKIKKSYLVALASLSCVACEKCAPGLVGQGLSRLTIRNIGAIATATNDDTVCGFESEAVKNAWVASAEPGQQGSVTWRTEDCVIEFLAEAPADSENCTGVVTSITGRLEVTATRTIEGYLTGNQGTPVIPNGPTAVTIEIESAEFKNFKVASSDSDAVLTMIDGSISGIVKPRVAADKTQGVCQIATGDATIENVRYGPSLVRIKTEDRDFEVDVDGSDLFAVNGKFDERENELWGNVSVWGSSQDIPIDDDERALNPDYDADKQVEAFSCKADLAQPVRYECETDVRPLIAQGASQLTIQTIGMIGKLAESDESCGFSSPGVKYAPQIEGALGDPGGSATYTIASPCEMTFAAATVIDTDCTGRNTYASGTVRVAGTKVVHGFVSGDPEDAIVPTTRDPAVVELVMDFTDFAVWTDPGDNKLTVESGQLAGRFMPRVAIDLTNGACAKQTPVATFESIAWSNARVEVASEGMTFAVSLDGSDLAAQNGSNGVVTNYLAGSLVMDGEMFSIPTGDNPVLDPNYDAAVFDQRYQCDADMRIPKSDTECNMQKTLGEGAGRLVIQTLGALGTMINDNSSCGFESKRVLIRPDRVEGDPGQQGLMEWSIDGCSMNSGSAAQYDDDCKGRKKYYTGAANFDAVRIVRGLREEIDIFGLFQIDSIVPNSHEAVELTLPAVRLRDFMAYDLNPGASDPTRAMLIEDATISAVVKPILAENAETVGRYDVKTNIAHMTNVRISGSRVSIFFEGKQFNVTLDGVELEAFNGSYAGMGMTNFIRGSVTINGETVTYESDAGLDPDFELSDFTERYQCRGLTDTIPPAP